MIVNKKFTIIPFASSPQEEILRIIARGPINGTDILAVVSLKLSITKQGLYKILRQLLFSEIIVKEKNFFVLNKLWLTRFSDFIEESEKNLGINLPFENSLLNGRKTIIFKNAEALDIYWGHLYLALAQKFEDKPFFFFNRHSWSIYERPQSENYLYKTSLKKAQKILITLGVNTLIAQNFKKQFAKNNIQITIDEEFLIPKTDSLCVVDDYFIATRYDYKTIGLMDKLFGQATAFGEVESKELHKILANCKKPKIIITKNAKKANTWRRRLAKNFVIKKSEL
jgi:hypothetical protein